LASFHFIISIISYFIAIIFDGFLRLRHYARYAIIIITPRFRFRHCQLAEPPPLLIRLFRFRQRFRWHELRQRHAVFISIIGFRQPMFRWR